MKTIKARYRNGVIEPMEALDIPDGTEINVTIDVATTLPEEEIRDRFLSAAGGWKDIIDDRFLEEIYRQRDLRTRPEVKL